MDEKRFRQLISGERGGAAAHLLRGGLRVMSWGYAAAVSLRNRAFDLGLRRSYAAPVPVISVGNLTAGGTGKTPFVAWLARWFRDRNVHVALLSRGYRALPEAVNDEKLLLDQLCPDVPHLQNPDRRAAAHQACRRHGAQLLILDDGFQHRRLRRDLDLVLIDALGPWGYDRLLPRGLLREPVTALKRASLAVITRADQCSAEEKQAIIDRVHSIAPGLDCIEIAYPPESLVNSEGTQAELSALSGQRVCAFCGIGNPQSFRRSLEQSGFEVAAFQTFPDHHHYTAEELETAGRGAAKNNAEALLVTMKDLVKIDRTELAGVPLWGIHIGTEILDGRETLEAELESVLNTL